MTELQKYYDERSKEIKAWKKYPDYFGKTKKIGKSKVTLLAGKQRGGVILVYSHLSSKDDDLNLFEQINFMHSSDALDEYRNLKTVKSILNIIRRNQ